MLFPSYSISPKDLWNATATRDAMQLVDVRRRDAYELSPHLLLGAAWRDASKAKQWAAEFDLARLIVAACKAGHEVSQSTAAQLRADGIDARVLEGGYEGWTKAGLACRHCAAMTSMDCSTEVSWFTMLCSLGCALLPSNDTTGRPKPRNQHANH